VATAFAFLHTLEGRGHRDPVRRLLRRLGLDGYRGPSLGMTTLSTDWVAPLERAGRLGQDYQGEAEGASVLGDGDGGAVIAFLSSAILARANSAKNVSP
jgi:hypothetical protein